MGKYLDMVRKFEERRQAEGQTEPQRIASPASPPAWPCLNCGQPAEIEAVEPSLDGERMLTYWHCDPCQSYAVTPGNVRQPPVAWVRRTLQ